MRVLVTGGAGFIGSHISDYLLSKGHLVYVLDNLSSGDRKNINPSCKLILHDIKKPFKKIEEIDSVFHFAADPEVRTSSLIPVKNFRNNVVGTLNILEWCRKNDVKNFVFASTSAVYGEAAVIPTPEDYPSFPISNYGASKVSCEAYVCSYAHTYGIKSTVLRYANIFGERSRHGVIHDFYLKLKKNPKKLEILGNGLQKKSYLYIKDAVNATILAWESQKHVFDIFNVGSEKKHTVNEVATIVCKELALSPSFSYTGGERGWVGDVRAMLLDVSKIKKLGWKEMVPFERGVHDYILWLREYYG